MGLNIADLAITSDDIQAGERIPDRFAADHGNQVPTLRVSGVPADAVELAVVMHDPDAPLPHGFTHWTVYGLPAKDGEIDPSSARTGPNTLGDAQWSGPQPPSGHGQHHYYFWVFALSEAVQGEPGREEFLAAYSEKFLEQNRFVATYSS